MKPNILQLVAFAQVNARFSCSSAEKKSVNLKNSIDKPIFFLV